MTADEIIDRLNLAPHPEGSHYRQTWVADNDGRATGTCIYFRQKADGISHWHRVDGVRVDATEIRHFHAGAALLLSLAADDHGPAHHWQSVAPPEPTRCTVSTGFEFAGFTFAHPALDIA